MKRIQPDMDDLPRRDWRCEECGTSNDCFDADCQYCDGPAIEAEELDQ